MASGIYSIKCILTNDCYVGSAESFTARWSGHRSLLGTGKHHSYKLQAAWDYHGEDWFEFQILELCHIDVLLTREQFYIDTLRPIYNVARFAGNLRGLFLGVPKTPEHTAKTQEGKRLRKARELAKQADQNRKTSFIKNDIRKEARQFKDEQIRAIRQDERQIVFIAADYGISPATIKKIKVRKTYQDVSDEGAVSKDTSLIPQSTAIIVFGIEYENVQAAYAAINPAVKASMIYYRLSHGMTPDQAFTESDPVREWLTQFNYTCDLHYTAPELFDDYKAFESSLFADNGINLSKQKWSNEFTKLIKANGRIRKYRTSLELYYIFEEQSAG